MIALIGLLVKYPPILIQSYLCLITMQDRIVEMTLDKEYDVAVQAVRLVISILK